MTSHRTEYPIDIMDALTNGQIVLIDHITNAAADNVGPPTGKKWIVLSGYVIHKTGTASTVTFTRIFSPSSTESFFTTVVAAAATANNSFPLFNLGIGETYSQTPFMIILCDKDVVQFGGDNAAYLNLCVLEW